MIRCRLPVRRSALLAAVLASPVAAQTALLSSAALQRIDSTAMAELGSTRTPGATLVIVSGDRIVYAQGYGLANMESGQPMVPDLVFRLGSTTKMMTSLAALSLAQKGVVQLDRPIGEMAPAIAAPGLRRLTLRQLLSHSAGLLDYTSMAGPHDDAAMNAFVPTLTDTVFFTSPGDIFSYSNLGFVVAGYVLSVAARKPYADVMHEEVFGPLGMARSTMRPIEAMTFPLAQGHNLRADGAFSVARPAPDDSRYWPAGSAFTTAPDFARLAIALLSEGMVAGKGALHPDVVSLLQTPQVDVPTAPGFARRRYAFGLEIASRRGERVVSHSGSRGGYGSVMLLLPDRKFGVIALANRTGAALMRTVDAVVEAVTGSVADAAPAPPSPMPPAPEERELLAGRWANLPHSGVLEFSLNAGELVARAQGDSSQVPVRKVGDSRFSAGSQTLTLVTGHDGRTRYLMAGSRAFKKQG